MDYFEISAVMFIYDVHFNVPSLNIQLSYIKDIFVNSFPLHF